MIHIHPFPARMAPEIALNTLSELKEGQTVLDPMSGSGMVLSLAARRGINSIGIDLDPLARLISLVGATKINEQDAVLALNILLEKAKKIEPYEVTLPWIDNDIETQKFISYWFAEKQARQLRAIVYYLVVDKKLIADEKIRNVLFVSLSRLIISKEPKASLARDTAHSRPHRTITENNFDIFEAFPISLKHVLHALSANEITENTQCYLGDARNLKDIKDGVIDAVITSPPYLNAIDYMRGNKFSLIWYGYRISELTEIRRITIGTEITSNSNIGFELDKIAKTIINSQLQNKLNKVIKKYIEDIFYQLKETRRVLKHGGIATYVIGNCTSNGIYIKNNEILKEIACFVGMKIDSEHTRVIPSNKRYLPVNISSNNSLYKRIRTEHIISFVK